MTLTPEQQAAADRAWEAWGRAAPSMDTEDWMFAAGIAHERARAAKVCNDIAEQHRKASREISAHAARECAEGIEQPS